MSPADFLLVLIVDFDRYLLIFFVLPVQENLLGVELDGLHAQWQWAGAYHKEFKVGSNEYTKLKLIVRP